MMTFLKGRKTYLTVAIGLLYVAGCALGFWDLSEEIVAALGLGGLAFLRAGVSKVKTETGPVEAPSSSRNVAGIALVAAVLALPGCANVEPGHDSVVVNAEGATRMAVDVFDIFLEWEFDNREALSVIPEVRQSADLIRAKGPGWLVAARQMTQAYKENRTPENRANLETAMAMLRYAVYEASNHLSNGVPGDKESKK